MKKEKGEGEARGDGVLGKRRGRRRRKNADG